MFAVDAGTIGYEVCAGSFLIAALVGLCTRLDMVRRFTLVAACLLTAAWAAAEISDPVLADYLVLLRSLGWIAFLAATLNAWPAWLVGSRLNRMAGSAGAVVLIGGGGLWVMALGAWGSQLLQLLLAVGGLLLAEALFRNCDSDSRWALKWICLGVTVILAFDFVLCADAVLNRQIAPDLDTIWGFIDALAAPLLIIGLRRHGSWATEVRFSPKVVYRSAVLLGSGFYLIAMSAAGTLLRVVGDGWGPVIQGAFIAGGIITLLVAVSSGTFRSTLRVLIQKHFFRHRFDYRQVWLNFILSLSSSTRDETLDGRILRAVAEIFDCPGAAMWVRRHGHDALFPTATWNFGPEPDPEPADGCLVAYLERTRWIVAMSEFAAEPKKYEGLTSPSWLKAMERAWVVVPLVHNGRLEGFLVLCKPRHEASFGWEEIDLLKTVGAQAASYLAERNLFIALADAKRLEEFSRRLAFVTHDVKNAVGQLSLMLENAKVHGHNPEFQRDMLATMGNTVERMRTILGRISGNANSGSEREATEPTDLAGVLRRVFEHWQHSIPRLAAKGLDGPVMALAGEAPLVTVLDHLLKNAADAAGPDGRVELALRQEADAVIIEVRDDGPGMDPVYIRDKLFRPLATSKPDGMGIGSYQARTLANDMGARIEVDSRPGHGTAMRLRLKPAVEAA